MKLSDFASSPTTTYEFKHPMTDEPTGIIATGNTPDSEEWRATEARLTNPNKKQSVRLTKDGNMLDLDPEAAKKRDKIAIRMVTNLTGFEDWEYSKDNIRTLWNDTKFNWMLEQWKEHLNERKNFFDNSAKDATSGLEA